MNLIHEDDTYFGCEVDHIISLKHGGSSGLDNLALACFFGNRYKGTYLGTILQGKFVRIFNPRSELWKNHFHFAEVTIEPLTEIGEATSRLLHFNDTLRLTEREALRSVGRYPSQAALLVAGTR